MKSLAIKGCIILLFCCSVGLFISSCFSARQCYTKPCTEGAGLDMLWSVHDGQGFQLVVSSMVVIAHSFSTYVILFKSSQSSLKYGMLVAVTGTLAFLMLLQGAVWGVKTRMIENLDEHLNGGHFYEQNSDCEVKAESPQDNLELKCLAEGSKCKWKYGTCMRALVVDMEARSVFTAVTTFSVLLFALQSLLCTFLLCWRADLGIQTVSISGQRVSHNQYTGDA